jgi:diguanylate cyclase
MEIDLSPTGRARVIGGTMLGIVFCVAAALFVDSFNFPNLSHAAVRRAVTVDIFLPAFLAGPLLFVLLWKMRQLAIAHRELSLIASTDSLTAVLNRGAFTMLVDAYLKQAREQASLRSGSLLLIDADHFKAINDKLGHQQGDQALKIIAKTIKASLRQTDLVGRIGGEEFGVFLPGADKDRAIDVAERIRTVIYRTIFPPLGSRSELSVSVGGVSFDREASYDDLFTVADRRLYAAKSNGRNQVNIGRFQPAAGPRPVQIH